MTPQNRNLGIRLDAPLSARLEHFEERTGVGAATLGRNALIAALNYFEAYGSISFPLLIIEASATKRNIVQMPEQRPQSDALVAETTTSQPSEPQTQVNYRDAVKRKPRVAKQG